MSLTRILARVLGGALLSVAAFSFAARTARIHGATRPSDAKAAADQEVLKINEECNAAELRADVAAMDACETEDFTHIHANGMVEHKTEYLKGVGSGEHKFLALDLSDVHVRSYGATAIVEEHMHLRANNSGRIADVNNLVMTVWTKQQGKWREAAWMAVGLPGSRPSASQSNKSEYLSTRIYRAGALAFAAFGLSCGRGICDEPLEGGKRSRRIGLIRDVHIA
jgi:ketosteroid isomerase-like protein